MGRTPQKDESRRGRWIVICGLSGLASFGPAEAADTIYRYDLRDGRVVYSDRPVGPGEPARVLKTERVVPGELWTRWALSEIHAYDARDRHAYYAHQRAAQDARSRVPLARQALARAERAREVGAEPLPGERVGNLNGTSRLRPEYFARQRMLERRVQDARANLERSLGAER